MFLLWFLDSQIIEMQALAAAYLEALEGQVNNGKCAQHALFVWEI